MSPRTTFRFAQLLLGSLFIAAGSLSFYLQSFLPFYFSFTPLVAWILLVLYLERHFFKCPNCGESIGFQGELLGFRLQGGWSVNKCHSCDFDLTKSSSACKRSGDIPTDKNRFRE